ncbi:E3 ubiquitin-protein ligase RGLG2 [Dichanthelium oligosanthes]|uniref:E3 ubiquitin-protein ligase RGLG2 n=1 Tax=Dichanthelium oligosanthes TaxID=888268 RepID=A0A1E5VZJ2_9POAL|nr:E3 ubiquitin-protein ligase RGLG2 [Dichanthelium oligosanthes]
MGQKDSKPSYSNSYPYDYGNTSSGYNPSYTGHTSSSYNARYAPSSQNNVQPETHARLQRKYSRIGDDYRSLSQVCAFMAWLHILLILLSALLFVICVMVLLPVQVTEALAQAGLESSNLIVGIDFTKSNEWTGKMSFNRRCLHDIGSTPNPYEQAISIIGRTLSAFDEDNLIPCFGFGDASTHDQEVFSFYPENRPCNGFEEALERYREIVPTLRLAGPTSFAPMIETAVGIVDSTGGQYHVLLIIADGQVTRSVDTQSGQLSPQERDTIDAIVRASQFPLSIVLVGVGDGPWDMMHQFDDNIPARSFDNFQFVNFTEIMSKSIAADRKEAEFALSALMEIPEQYKATLDLQLLGCRKPLADNTQCFRYTIPVLHSRLLTHVFADLLRVREKFGALPSVPAEHNHKDQALLT